MERTDFEEKVNTWLTVHVSPIFSMASSPLLLHPLVWKRAKPWKMSLPHRQIRLQVFWKSFWLWALRQHEEHTSAELSGFAACWVLAASNPYQADQKNDDRAGCDVSGCVRLHVAIENIVISIPLETGGQDKEPAVEIRARHGSVPKSVQAAKLEIEIAGVSMPAMGLAVGRVARVLWMLWRSAANRPLWRHATPCCITSFRWSVCQVSIYEAGGVRMVPPQDLRVTCVMEPDRISLPQGQNPKKRPEEIAEITKNHLCQSPRIGLW